jgi:hypothetical protein
MLKKWLVKWTETRVVTLGEQPSGATRLDPNRRFYCKPLANDRFPFISRFGGETVVFCSTAKEAETQMLQLSNRLRVLDIIAA